MTLSVVWAAGRAEYMYMYVCIYYVCMSFPQKNLCMYVLVVFIHVYINVCVCMYVCMNDILQNLTSPNRF